MEDAESDLFLSVGKSILIANPPRQGIREATLYPALPNLDAKTLAAAPGDVLGAIQHLRIDTVNGCNLSCVFCHSDFSAKMKHLEPEDFSDALLGGRFPTLKTITMGCAYEPLMGKHFEAYPKAVPSLKGVLEPHIVTNGLLLHKKDLGPWVEFGLRRIYISVYSHIEEIYERTARNGGRFRQIEKNLLELKARFPSLAVDIITPLCKANDVDVPAFCRWAFDHVGASTIDLRRAFFTDAPAEGYPAYTYTAPTSAALGRSPRLTDREWSDILQSCSSYLSDATRRVISLGGAIDYPSVILSAS